MPQITIEKPADLQNRFTKLFPEYLVEPNEAEPSSYHRVVMDLAPHLSRLLASGSEERVHSFAEIVNQMVAIGGLQQNAVETCLLEHASRIDCYRLLKPLLSDDARRELR